MKRHVNLLFFLILTVTSFALTLDEINIRDPFIFTDNDKGMYYMYRTSDSIMADGNVRGGVEVFTSRNLSSWDGPQTVMRIPDDNALTGTVWAPEVHHYNGNYYLFATISSDIEWKKGKKDGVNIHGEAPRFFMQTVRKAPLCHSASSLPHQWTGWLLMVLCG